MSENRNPVISVEKLGKSYRLGLTHEDLLTNRFIRGIRSIFNAEIRRDRESKIFWALRDISFEVCKGEIVGIIGKNGAGKSTLLKILSRITEPTEGCVRLNGRVASLLEVGTGFHPELTGRENIDLNGTILGMSKREIDNKFDEIVSFAEIDDFIDTPVKRYSSGMYVRLAFAVAAHLEPEIMVVDEVLAVGDLAFQKKCLGKMETMTGEGRTVLFVSHNMAAISSLCSRAILIDHGKIINDDEVSVTVGHYMQENLADQPYLEGEELKKRERNVRHKGITYFDCTGVYIQDKDGKRRSTFLSSEEIVFEIYYTCFVKTPIFKIQFNISTEEGFFLGCCSSLDHISGDFVGLQPGKYRSRCTLIPPLFGEKTFLVTPSMAYQDAQHLLFPNALKFAIILDPKNGNIERHSRFVHIKPHSKWETRVSECEQISV